MSFGPCGGKGNRGRMIEREMRICAAGKPTSQENDVSQSMNRYTLQDHHDALIGDTIFPYHQHPTLLPLRRPPPPDVRYAGLNTDIRQCINRPITTNIENIVNDLKETVYASSWKKVLGQVADQKPMLPQGMDIYGTTFGKKTPYNGRLYDIILPPIPMPDATHKSKYPGHQTSHNFEEPFNQFLTYGHRNNLTADVRGRKMKCALQDDRIISGTDKVNIMSSIQADFEKKHHCSVGESLKPNDIENQLPDCHVFGISTKSNDGVAHAIAHAKINPEVDEYRNCLAQLNQLRKNLSKRFLPTFFRTFYLQLKYMDVNHTDWLPKDLVYNACANFHIRFNQPMIELLLRHWGVFDGENLDYKFFVRILNFKEPVPLLPRMCPLAPEDLYYNTTYGMMTRPNQPVDERYPSGIPSSRVDLDFQNTPPFLCKATRINLPSETGVKNCIAPSVLSMFNISHRDMFKARTPDSCRRVFEAMNDKPYTDEEFNAIWNKASSTHSKGWVCFQTFREAAKEIDDSKQFETKQFIAEFDLP